MISVEICQERESWDRFVGACPQACNYHRWIWQKAIQDTFGHEPYYLAAMENGVTAGILPLFAIKSWLFGQSLVSIPFFSYGGVVANNATISAALLKRAATLASEVGARHVELRQGDAYPTGWAETATKVSMEIPLPSTTDALWKRLSSGLRNKIRNGRKSDFRVCWGGLDDIKHFYSVFAINMRNLGTPVYPRAWFENLWRCASDDIRVLTLWDGNAVVAAAFLNAYRNTLELPWSASLPESRKKYSQVFLYWTFLEWAIEHGFTRMDLGRCTPGGGTYEFKRHWVCEERPLYWYYWLSPGAQLPQLKPDNGRYRLAVKMWKHLPVAIANEIGPRIVCSIP